MKFCIKCGASTEIRIPEGDNRERLVCVKCEYIFYQNPRIIAGYLPFYENKILLCKRAIEPRAGYWTLPAGFLENNETVQDGALRESLEEANAQIEGGELYGMFSLPHISQVYIFYLGKLKDLNFSPGQESLDVRLFSEADIPWNEIAFPVVDKLIRYYFEDKEKGKFNVHTEDLIYQPQR